MSFNLEKIEFLFQSLKNLEYCEGFKKSCEKSEGLSFKWSKFLACNVLPFYSELTGFKLDKLSDKEYKSANFKYTFHNGKLILIEEFGRDRNVVGREYISYEGVNFISIEFDEDCMPFRMKLVELELGIPVHGYMVDDLGMYWCYEYLNDGLRINSLRDYSKNSLKPFVGLKVSYNDEGGVDQLISVANGSTNIIQLN